MFNLSLKTGVKNWYIPNYLCFTANTSGTQIKIGKTGSPTNVQLEISQDGINRTDYTIGTYITLTNVGEKIYIRNKSETDTTFSQSASKYYRFYISGQAFCSGDITFLLNKNGSKKLSPYCFYRLFYSCSSLLSTPELPVTTLADYCYYLMFRGCNQIKKTPELPATTLAEGCYASMFQGCTLLKKSSELPVTALTDYCYFQMFNKCTSLTKAPELPATILTTECYKSMFNGCTSLTEAPELPATTLAEGCYASMFYGCTSLTEAPELPVTTLANNCYEYMFYGCTSLTEAPELPATTLTNYCYNYMFKGCTSLTQLPKLGAVTLVSSCYSNMFYGCSNIKLSTSQDEDYTQEYRIPTTGNGSGPTNAKTNMFRLTGGSFSGAPDLNTIYYVHKDNTIVPVEE